jgi:hypothetical protein
MSTLGPFGIDPLYFSLTLFGFLLLFVLYLLLPRGARVHYFSSYPKRYAWSARPRRRRMAGGGSGSQVGSTMSGTQGSTNSFGSIFGRGRGGAAMNAMQNSGEYGRNKGIAAGSAGGSNMEESIEFGTINGRSKQQSDPSLSGDEAAVSSAMAQLRNQGVVIVAHGSRGKPKTVRLQLTEESITWRTETRRKNASGQNKEIKLGKLHSVALNNIMYVDVGKQTTALRRHENSSVPESLCFSLLTKEGSLDLEANSPRERDALVGSFSLVLDDVHAKNWRDIYRASNEMPSSFDEYDEENGVGVQR